MPADPEGIACWQRLTPLITTSGRLTCDDVPALAGIGVRHVINLALSDSPGALAAEAERLAQCGMGYTHIPVPFGAPGEEHFAAFVRALALAPRPVHVHCIMNWRVSAFFYRYHREHGDVAEADARALMEQHWSPGNSRHADAPAWAAFIGC